MMPATNTYKDIEYSLKKSDRKTTSIYIERDGSVSVLAPKPFDLNKVESVLEKKRRWIYRGLAEWQDLNRTKVHREYVNGESFLYLGRNYQLEIVRNQFKPLLLKQGKFSLDKADVENAQTHFREFYKTKLSRKLKEKVPYFAAKMGLEPSAIKVLELKNRWGSCTRKGVVNIHWKCAMLPPNVLDYVIVHELAHIKYPNHTPAFWRVVEKVLLSYDAEKNWLKFNGAGMSL
jgi:predicted metal-dependent hydrolase